MFEIFMAICALTALECNSVTVAYEQLPNESWNAVAGYDKAGKYYILLNPVMEKKSEKFIQRLMVHEIAHLLAFDADKSNITHYGAYEVLCKDLAIRANVQNRYTCKPYSTRPPYPWRELRRE